MKTENYRVAVIYVIAFALFVTRNVAAAEQLQWDKQLIHNQLENQFSYIAYPSKDQSDPFNLRLIVHAGSIDDEMRGIAHIVEHMVFRANRAHPHSVHAFLDYLGWKTGVQINARTRQTETQYMLRTRPNDALNVTQSIKLMSDLAFGAKMLGQDWDIEKGVVLEEMRLFNNVAKRVNTAKKKVIRNGSRYVDRPTIGYREQVEDTTVAEIRAFYDKFYVPANMTLVASGYFDEATLVKAISSYFGAEPYKPAPDRSYVELPLKAGLYIAKVQDDEGTTSAVTLGFRSAIQSKATLAGNYQRLQHYFLRKIVSTQLRQLLKSNYSEKLKSLNITFKTSTNERLIAAISAKTDDYQYALKVLLKEVERIKQSGIDPSVLAQLKQTVRQTIKASQTAASHRDYAKWEDKITEAVIQNGVLEDYQQRSQRTLNWVNALTVEELNTQLNELLSAPDQFLFYQIPGGINVALPSIELVQHLKEQLVTESLPLIKVETAEKSSSKAQLTASINWPSEKLAVAHVKSKTIYRSQNVTEWQLANGDRLVWLEQPTADGQLYLKALSSAGYLNDKLPSWLSQTALQAWQQSAQPFASNKQLNQWQEQNEVSWKWMQKASELDLSSKVSSANLAKLMRSYYLKHKQWQFNKRDLKSLKNALKENINKDQQRAYHKQQATLLSHGKSQRPDIREVEALSLPTLKSAINMLSQQPSTLFVVGQIDEQTLAANVLPYLAAIKRSPSLTSRHESIANGKRYAQAQIYLENKATVEVKSRSALQWAPEQSFLVSSLNPIIQRALKNRLRHQLGGVYRVEFETHLDKDNQLRTTTRFTTAPEKVTPLIAAYQQVLADLPTLLVSENYQRMQKNITFAEQLRLQAPSTWLRRLALSYQRYDNPQYLQSMLKLPEQVNAQHLIPLVQQIFPPSNQAIFVGLPLNQ